MFYGLDDRYNNIVGYDNYLDGGEDRYNYRLKLLEQIKDNFKHNNLDLLYTEHSDDEFGLIKLAYTLNKEIGITDSEYLMSLCGVVMNRDVTVQEDDEVLLITKYDTESNIEITIIFEKTTQLERILRFNNIKELQR